MLTEEQISNNKIKFLEILSKLNIDLTPISKYLDSVDYFNKPISIRGDQTYAGSLCEYSLNLCYELGNLCGAYCPEKYSKEDIIKVALFKELYRAEYYEAYLKNVKDETTGSWITTRAWKIADNRRKFGDLYFNSFMIAKRFINFTDEQIEAICFANSNDCYGGDIYDIRREYPLVALTKMAEIAATDLVN